MHKINPKTGQRYPPKRLSNYKKAVKLEEGLEFARLKAQDRWKKSTKGFMRSIQDHVGKAIDRIDPLETAAVLGLTFIVHGIIIDEKNVYHEHLKKIRGMKKLVWGRAAEKLGISLEEWNIPETETADITQEMFDWIISFTLAYCIIKYGGQLLGLLDKDLVKVVGMLLGV